MVEPDPARAAELIERLAAVRTRLFDACASAGRDPRSVTLVAVTKTYPATDARTLAAAGVLDLGEARDQEASAKAAEVARQSAGSIAAVRWHFLGQLQSRKCRSVAAYAHSVHSVDRLDLVNRLAAAVTTLDRGPLEIFVQVSLDGDPDRGGTAPDEVAALADAVAVHPQLRLRGVMAVAPLGVPAGEAFARLAEISASLRVHHPTADAISAGMSADLEQAIQHGSTHVRVGSALLGRRSPVFG